jgi:heat shock protein HslJ
MLRYALVALLALSLAACGADEDADPPADDDPTSEAAPSAPATSAAEPPELAGRAFLLEEAEVGGAPRPLAGDRPIGLQFEADRLGAEPGCNGAGAPYVVEGGRLVLTGEVQQTLMMCEDAALVEQDEWFVAFLQTGPQIVVDNTSIELRSEDTVLRGRDREVADPDRPLAGTSWRIASRIEGDAVSGESWMEDSELVFADGGTVSGRTACGTIAGTWSLQGDLLSVELEERGPCEGPDDPGGTEDRTFALLDGELTVEIEADLARLLAADGRGVELRDRSTAP